MVVVPYDESILTKVLVSLVFFQVLKHLHVHVCNNVQGKEAYTVILLATFIFMHKLSMSS